MTRPAPQERPAPAAGSTWTTGRPGWRCANCGRANIYHDPETGRCPAPDDETPKVS